MPLDPMLVDLGWDEDLARRLSAAGPGLVPARAMEAGRGFVRVCGSQGEWLAPIPPALRRDTGPWSQPGPPVTGDWLVLEPGSAVRGILPRRSRVRRFDETAGDEVLVANADLAVVVASLNRDLSLSRMERLLAIADEAGIPRIVALSKSDLCQDPGAEAQRVSAQLHVDVLAFSSRTGDGLDALRRRLRPRRTTVLIGSSGVGKSTLVNTLLGHHLQRTLDIRAGDDHGRHATTSRTVLRLPGGELVVDTPGLRSPRPAAESGLRTTFRDVFRLAAECRFPDCSHGSEPACAVRPAVQSGQLALRRLSALRKLEAELAEQGGDPARRRRRGRRRSPGRSRDIDGEEGAR